MHQTEKANITAEVLAEIRAAVVDGTIDEVSAAGLRRKAEKVRANASYIDGCILLGHIEGWRWNLKGVVSNFESALRQGTSSRLLRHYSIALRLAGDYFRSSAASERAADTSKADLDLLRAAIADAKIIGMHAKAGAMIVDYAKRTPDRAPTQNDAWEIGLQLTERLASSGVAPDLASRCHEVAMRLLSENKIRVEGARFEVDDEQRQGGVFCFLRAGASQDVLDVLDDELAVLLFDEIRDLDLNAYWIGYEATK